MGLPPAVARIFERADRARHREGTLRCSIELSTWWVYIYIQTREQCIERHAVPSWSLFLHIGVTKATVQLLALAVPFRPCFCHNATGFLLHEGIGPLPMQMPMFPESIDLDRTDRTKFLFVEVLTCLQHTFDIFE